MKKQLYILIVILALVVAAPCPALQQESDVLELVFSPTLSGGFLMPVSTLSDYSTMGGGGELGLELENLFFNRSVIKLCAGYNFVNDTINLVDTFGISSFTLAAGYSIPLAEWLSMVPQVGGGYLGHFLDATDTLAFFDPQMNLGIDFDLG
ncbi:MAG: hypothetical protein EHM28_12405, partial [Spirochaetaceae bacterium]